MKILMVLMGLEIGGAETHVAELAIELSRRGHEIHVASNGGVYEHEIAKHGIVHHKLPLHTKMPGAMFESYLGLRSIIKQNKFDIVHSHARIPSFICSLLHRELKFRLITSAHWVFKTDFLLKRITSWGEKSVAVSNDIKKYLIDNYKYPEEDISVTINGIDTNKFSENTDFTDIKEEFNLGDDKKRIVYISRMDVDRSAVAFNLLNIAPRLYEKYPDIEIVIVGGGNDYDRLVENVDKTNNEVGKRIVITTGARTDINKFVASCDIFVGVSRSALEAMSAKKPVIIAGNEGYIGTFDKDKIDISTKTNFCCRGCVMPNDDILFDDICKIFDNTDVGAMASFNRQFIIDNYSVEKMVNDYEDAYADLLSKNPFRTNDVLISGYYGFKNTGDDSLLKSIIQNLKEQKSDVTITVLSKNPSETSSIYGVKSINRYNIPLIYLTLKNTRLLISGGGSLLQDVTSTKSYKYYSFIIKMALWCKAKVMIYANGIGPLTSAKNREDCKKMLEKVDYISIRDTNSFEELQRMGLKREVSVSADPAFALSCEELPYDNSEPYFIVSVRKWKDLPYNFEETIGNVCKKIYQKYNLKPIFVPMQHKMDYALCKSIAGKCGGGILSEPIGVERLMGYIKNSEFVIGMRLHALIYSLSMNVPVLGLSYDPKIDAIIDKWSCCNTIDAKTVNEDELLEQVEYIIKNRQTLFTEIKMISANMREKTVSDTKMAIKLINF